MTADLTFGPYDPAATPAVVSLWNAVMGDSYPLREALLRQNLDANPNFRPSDAVVVYRGDRIAGFGLLQRYRGDAPLCHAWRDLAWLAAVVVAPEDQRQGIGTRIHDWLIDRANGIAPEAVSPGGGIHWFFPGAPIELPAARPFLESLGFRFSRSVSDVRVDLTSFRSPTESQRTIERHGLVVVRCSPAETASLLDFLAAEFGAGWWYNADRFFRAGGAPGDWLLLRRGAEIVGMARLHHPGQAVIGAPRYWRAESSAGGLGPIGVAASLRGYGLGLALLQVTLDRLHTLGVTDAVADWTDLIAFYAKAGFAPWHTYETGLRARSADDA